jgi:hypothetical protein
MIIFVWQPDGQPSLKVYQPILVHGKSMYVKERERERLCVCVCVYIYIYIYMCVCVYIYIYIYIYISHIGAT